MMFTAITARWTRRTETMDERTIDWGAARSLLGAAGIPHHLMDKMDGVLGERVTRCAGCAHWDADGRSLSCQHGCSKWLITTPPGFFCAGGEPCARG